MTKPTKIIDLFAGPGGLGEGFSARLGKDGNPLFRIALSIEKEASAHRTLQLRAFFRQFARGEAPRAYYEFLEGKLGPDPEKGLFRDSRYEKQAAAARREAQKLTLGEMRARVYGAVDDALSREPGEDWVLIGGPPCQAYSLVGRARNRGIRGYRIEDDLRSGLYREYLRIINRFNPAVFVMENVKGLLSAKLNGDSIFERICEDLRKPGKALSSRMRSKSEYAIFSFVVPSPTGDPLGQRYTPGDYVIRSERFGIPQTRHRVILLGVRTDVLSGRTIGILSPANPPKLRDVVSDLPRIRSGLSREGDSAKAWASSILAGAEATIRAIRENGHPDVADTMEAAVAKITQEKLDRGSNWSTGKSVGPLDGLSSPLAEWYRDPTGWVGVCNHDSRGHMRSDLLRYLFSSCFSEAQPDGAKRAPKAKEFPIILAPAHSNWASGHFADRFRVQLPDRPAATITSHISKDGHYFIHYDPTQCRSLTVREAARVQTFPDNYFFVGNRTQQYVQVGNAVPPFLAHQIAGIVAELI